MSTRSPPGKRFFGGKFSIRTGGGIVQGLSVGYVGFCSMIMGGGMVLIFCLSVGYVGYCSMIMGGSRVVLGLSETE